MKKTVLFLIFLLLFSADGKAKAAETVCLPIVMYHHVSPEPGRWNDYVVSVEEFRSDMIYLRERGWESINISELLAWSRGEFTMPAKPLMISFDDGFSGVAEYAEPILEELGFKAVMALIGSVCEEYSRSGDTDPAYSHLSWERAGEMAQRGIIEMQCHSYALHSMSAPMGCSKGRGEGGSIYRQRLSADLSRFMTEAGEHELSYSMSIAYPFGAYGVETTEIIKDMGFAAAFTCDERINLLTGAEEELYHLGRFNRPHGISSENFFLKWEKSLDNA